MVGDEQESDSESGEEEQHGDQQADGVDGEACIVLMLTSDRRRDCVMLRAGEDLDALVALALHVIQAVLVRVEDLPRVRPHVARRRVMIPINKWASDSELIRRAVGKFVSQVDVRAF